MSGAELSVERVAEYRRYVDELLREVESSATPRAVLGAGRSAAEVMCKHCYEQRIGPAGKMMLDELATKLHQKGVVPPRPATAIRTVQAFGNLGAHPQADLVAPSADDVAAMRAALKIVRDWYERDVAPPIALEKRSRLPLVVGGAVVMMGAGIVYAVTRGDAGSTSAIKEPTRDAAVADVASVDALPPARPGMVRIQGGTFDMGTTPAERAAALALCREVERRSVADCAVEEKIILREELRPVTVTTFDLDRFEVTVSAFVAWAKRDHVDLPASIDAAAPDRPVTGVTWQLARRYCEHDGKRLPTEAEWELAARGVQRRTFSWGDATPACADVVFAREDNRPCSAQPHGAANVGSATRDVTVDGVHDLGGNVTEWTADAALPRPTCAGACIDPHIDGAPGDKRVLRGGNWRGGISWLRAAGRSELPSETAATNIGVRCAASVVRGEP